MNAIFIAEGYASPDILFQVLFLVDLCPTEIKDTVKLDVHYKLENGKCFFLLVLNIFRSGSVDQRFAATFRSATKSLLLGCNFQ